VATSKAHKTIKSGKQKTSDMGDQNILRQFFLQDTLFLKILIVC